MFVEKKGLQILTPDYPDNSNFAGTERIIPLQLQHSKHVFRTFWHHLDTNAARSHLF